jgi:hypothetical protein
VSNGRIWRTKQQAPGCHKTKEFEEYLATFQIVLKYAQVQVFMTSLTTRTSTITTLNLAPDTCCGSAMASCRSVYICLVFPKTGFDFRASPILAQSTRLKNNGEKQALTVDITEKL